MPSCKDGSVLVTRLLNDPAIDRCGRANMFRLSAFGFRLSASGSRFWIKPKAKSPEPKAVLYLPSVRMIDCTSGRCGDCGASFRNVSKWPAIRSMRFTFEYARPA